MSDYAVVSGKTSLMVDVFIQSSASTTGDGLTGLVFNSAGISAYYHRSGAATATAITLATATVGSFTSGGFKEVDSSNMPGVYQIGIPDAALASGATEVSFLLKGATNMVPKSFKIPLRAFSQDAAGVSITTGGIVAGSITDGSLTGAKFASDGTAQAGAATTITLASGASATNDYYQYQVVAVVSGTGSGQSRLVTGYNGGTKVATVDRAWAVNPDNTSQYVVSSQGPVYVNTISSVASGVIRDAVTDDIIETQGSYTLQQAMSIVLAAVSGRSSGGNTIFSTPNNAATRISATVDASNNRTAITLTPSA